MVSSKREHKGQGASAGDAPEPIVRLRLEESAVVTAPNRHGRISSAKVEMLPAMPIPKLPSSLCVWDMPGGRSLLGHAAYEGERVVERIGDISGEAVAGVANKAAAMTLAGTLSAFSVAPQALAYAADEGSSAGVGSGVAACSVEGASSASAGSAGGAGGGSGSGADSGAGSNAESAASSDGASSGSGAGASSDDSAGGSTGAGGAFEGAGSGGGNAAGANASAGAAGAASSSAAGNAGSAGAGSTSGAAGSGGVSISGNASDAPTSSTSTIDVAGESVGAFGMAGAAEGALLAGANVAGEAGAEGEPVALESTVDPNLVRTQDDLQTAINDLGGVGTIRLKDNISLSGSILIPAGANLTINLNGNTLTGSGSCVFDMTDGGYLKIMSKNTENAGIAGVVDASACSALVSNSGASGSAATVLQEGYVTVRAATPFSNQSNWDFTLNGTLSLSKTVTMGDNTSFKVEAAVSSKASLTSTAPAFAFELVGSGANFARTTGSVSTTNSAFLVDNANASLMIGGLNVASGDAVTCKQAKRVSFFGITTALNGLVLKADDGFSGVMELQPAARFSDISVMPYLGSGHGIKYVSGRDYREFPYQVSSLPSESDHFGTIDGVYCTSASDFDKLWQLRGPNCIVSGIKYNVGFWGADGAAIKVVSVFKGHCLGGKYSSIAGGADNKPPATSYMEEQVGEDYTFDGWVLDGDTSGRVYTEADLATLVVTKDMTFKAKRTPIAKYAVTFNYRMLAADSDEDVAGAVVPESVVEQIRLGLSVDSAVPTPPEIEGYDFIGWFNSAGEAVDSFAGITVDGEVSFEGRYRAKAVVVPEPGGSGGSGEPEPGGGEPGGGETDPEPEPGPGETEPEPDPEPSGPDEPQPEQPTDPVDPEEPDGPAGPSGSQPEEPGGPSDPDPDGPGGSEGGSVTDPPPGGTGSDSGAGSAEGAPAMPPASGAEDLPPLTSIALGGAGVPVPGAGQGRFRDGEAGAGTAAASADAPTDEHAEDGDAKGEAEEGAENRGAERQRDAGTDPAGSQAADLAAFLEILKMAAMPLAVAGGTAVVMLAIMSSSRHAAQAGAAIAKSAASAGPEPK